MTPIVSKDFHSVWKYILQIKTDEKSRRKSKQKKVTQISMMEQPNPQEQRVYSLLLPFAGSQGSTIVKNLNKTLENALPNSVKTRITYTVKKLSSKFQIK